MAGSAGRTPYSWAPNKRVAASEPTSPATTPAPFLERWNAEARPGELLMEYVGRTDVPPDGSDLATVLAGYVSVGLLGGVATADAAGAVAAVSAVVA